MIRICKHFRWNCPLCFPVPSTPTNAGGSAVNQSSSQQQQTTNGNRNTIAPTAAATTQTTTGSGAITGAPTGTGIIAAAATVPGSSTISASSAAVLTTPSGATKRTSTSVTAPRKRRRKIPRTVIDDQVACRVFRDLQLDRSFLNSGQVLAWALQPEDPAFVMIHNYVAASQPSYYGIKILSILRVIVKSDEDPVDFSNDPNVIGKHRMMLWHGTSRTVVASILKNGLRLPYWGGQSFGPGIYFADRVSKSCFYCNYFFSSVGSHAYLFLCDVLVGNMYKVYYPRSFDRAPIYNNIQYDSIKGCGANAPAPEWNNTIEGCVWPVGPSVPNKEDNEYIRLLDYNEYIVYKQEQVQPKYLVKVEFTAHPVAEILN